MLRGTMKHTIALAVSLALAVLGCKKSGDKPAGGGSGTAEQGGGGGGGGGAKDEILGEKLNASIECLNRHSGRIFEARDFYLQRVDKDKGPEAGKEVSLLGLYSLDPCAANVKKAAALTPAVPELDKAALAYIAALETLLTTYEDFEGYFKKGEFRTDGGKKGTETHTKLMAAFTAFADANTVLDAIVGTENRKQRLADLARREKAEGRKLGVVLDSMMLDAETVVDALSVGPDQLVAGDPAALDATIATYAKGVDEFEAYLKAHADEAQKVGSRDNLVNYSQSFLGQARAIAEKVKAKKPPTADELEKATDQYNSLVDNYNRSSR
jgi:hypothetical protein